jgi:hypothetical protein
MSSDRQIAANQSNAKKSTGPSTQAGRDVARLNSRRHGLAVDIGSDPAFQADIEKLAKILSDGVDTRIEQAREFAAAQLDLSRIRNFRAGLFVDCYLTNSVRPDHLQSLNEQLVKLERYERRAYARRKKALRALH